jgi:hypothetical protein
MGYLVSEKKGEFLLSRLASALRTAGSAAAIN